MHRGAAHEDKSDRTLFSVNTLTPRTITVDAGEEFTVEVRGAFGDVEDINAIPTLFTPACDGHPLAPIAGPIVVRRAKPGMASRSIVVP
jgi:acetamidase/formamidase